MPDVDPRARAARRRAEERLETGYGWPASRRHRLRARLVAIAGLEALAAAALVLVQPEIGDLPAWGLPLALMASAVGFLVAAALDR